MARANERCCRRCHRNLPGCSCGDGARHTRRSARLHRNPNGDGDADRISALPDDLLLQILTRLGCIHAAARTGVLSRRWRGLWTRLPELVLREVTPASIDAVLAHLVARFGPQARPQPPLSLLDVRAPNYFAFSTHQIASLFDAAAALQPANLVVHVVAVRPCVVTLPRLDRTKSITLDVLNISLLPPQDQDGPEDMPALQSMSLRRYDPLLILQLNCFSNLHSLSVSNLRHHTILIVLPVLEELFLLANVRLKHVCIFAPMLKKLTLQARVGVADHFFMQCLVPKVEDFSWRCTDFESHVSFGDIWSLRTVTIKTSEALEQLQHTSRSNMYTLCLNIWERDEDEVFAQEGAAPSFQDYIASLFPVANQFHFANEFSVLELCISSCGHVYGAMVLQLLDVYKLIAMLKVDLRKVQARGLCSANCLCIQLKNWRNWTICLAHLKEVEIKGVRGEDYDIDMLKVILRSAAMLERVAFTFSLKSEQRIRHFSSKIHSILKAHPSVECKIYRCSGEQVLSA